MNMPFFQRFRSKKKQPHVTVFDGQDYRKAMLAATAWLELHCDAINKLNVFPVPDGDTGKNMSETMRAATKAVSEVTDTNVSVVAKKLSEGAIRGARGNSGVILSQILRGIANSIEMKSTINAEDFSLALQTAAQNAYRAVVKPVEGTILTVIRESAEAAKSAVDHGADITLLMQEVVSRARQTVAHTPELLPTLKDAGVVDAGGQGLTTIFEGFLRYTRGESAPAAPSNKELLADDMIAEAHRGAVSVDEEFGYEVVFLLRGEKLDVDGIRAAIIEMGGVSTVVAGDETLLKVHTHTLSPGKILDYGVSLGSLEDINIENLQAQSLRYAADSANERGVADTSTASAGAIPQSDVTRQTSRKLSNLAATGEIATIAIVSGEGFERVFDSLKVTAVVPGGQTMNPSTQEILDAVNSVTASKVIILPNNSNVIMSAQQVQQLTAKEIRVIPTKTMPQGVAALMAFRFDGELDSNVKTMQDAYSEVVTAEITRSVRDAQFHTIAVRENDIISLVDDKLVFSGQDITEALHIALDAMNLAAREVLTLYFGQDIQMETAEEVSQKINSWFPDIEIEIVYGGQPYYMYIIAAE